jgi:hypothetical protein
MTGVGESVDVGMWSASHEVSEESVMKDRIASSPNEKQRNPKATQVAGGLLQGHP